MAGETINPIAAGLPSIKANSTNFENLKEMSLDEFAEWLDKYGQFDGSPWMEWFTQNYCDKCESIKVTLPDNFLHVKESVCSYCELEHKCRFFLDMDHEPTNIETIKMWLEKVQ